MIVLDGLSFIFTLVAVIWAMSMPESYPSFTGIDLLERNWVLNHIRFNNILEEAKFDCQDKFASVDQINVTGTKICDYEGNALECLSFTETRFEKSFNYGYECSHNS